MNKQYKVKPWYTYPEKANLSAQDVQDMLNFSVECGATGVEGVSGSFSTFNIKSPYPFGNHSLWGLTRIGLETHTSSNNEHLCENKVSSLQELKDLFSEGVEQSPEELVVEDRYKFLEDVGSAELRTLELLVGAINESDIELLSSHGTKYSCRPFATAYLQAMVKWFTKLNEEVLRYSPKGLLNIKELSQLQNKTKIEDLEASIKSQQEELEALKQGF